MRVRRTAAAVCLATGLLTGGDVYAATEACTYQPQQIAGLPGGNGAGQLVETDGNRHFVGWAFIGSTGDPYPHGVVWRDGSVVADFGALGGPNSVNRSGDAVGSVFGSASGNVLPHDGAMTQLARPAGMNRSNPSPVSIGDDGLIIGNGRFDDGTVHALSWSLATAATTVRDLGVLGIAPPPSQRNWPGLHEVSDTGGRLVGTVKTGDRLRAVAGTAGSLTPLGGVDPNLDSEATDIAGRFILGTGTVPGQGRGAVLWEDGTARLLPTTGTAADVNTNGLVVGHDADQAIVLENGIRTTLPPLPGHTKARALTVTEDGRIAGWSRSPSAEQFVDSVPVIWSCA